MPKNKKTFFSNFFYLLWLSGILLIIAKPLSAQQYFFQNYNTENGLVQSQPYCFAQDKFNRLWIGTFGGLSIFDGTEFKNYGRADGLLNNVIYSIDFSVDGSAWLSTPDGLSHYDGLRFVNYKFPSRINLESASSVIVDNRNRIWILFQNPNSTDLYQLINGKYIKQSKEDNYAISISKSKSGILHISYLNLGVFKYENDKWQQVFKPKSNRIFSSCFAPDGSLYVTTPEGISQVKDGRSETVFTFNKKPKLDDVLLTKIAVDAHGKIWLSGASGLQLIEDKKVHLFTLQNGYSDDQTFKIFVDNYDNKWFGTNGSGLFKYAESPFSRFDSKLIRNIRGVGNISKIGDELYLSGLFSGIYTLNTNNYKVAPFLNSNVPKYLSSIYVVPDGAIYFSSLNEVGFYKSGQLQKLDLPVGMFPYRWIKAFGDIWIFTSDGFYKLVNHKFEKLLSQTDIIDFCATTDGRFLLVVNNRVKIFDPRDSSLSNIDAFDRYHIANVAADSKRYYGGSDDHGVVIYDIEKQSIETVDQNQGLSNNFVYNVFVDNTGRAWVGTASGIDRLVFNDDGKYFLKSYGRSDGLIGVESNTKAVFQDRDSVIWFGTTKGLFRYDADLENPAAVAPYVRLTSVQLFYHPIKLGTLSDSTIPFLNIPYKPKFENNQNTLTFSFQAVCLSSPEKINYRYKLEGADKKFIESKLSTVTYSQLAPGKYTFIVFASDEDGHWYDNAYRYSFTIKAKFYQTLWFEVLSVLLLIGIAAYFIYQYSQRNRRRILREQKLREEEQNKVRQRTAEDFHDEIGNKITRINLLTMMAEKKSKENDAVQNILQQIRQNTQSLYYGSKDIIWALQKESNYLKEALLRIQQNTIAILNETGVKLLIEEEPAIKEGLLMPMDYGRNLILIFKEAVNNALKYSSATVLTLRFYEDIDNAIVLELEDNGKGFDMAQLERGNGLNNMQNRANAIKAKFSIQSQEGKGTLIRLRMFGYSFK